VTWNRYATKSGVKRLEWPDPLTRCGSR